MEGKHALPFHCIAEFFKNAEKQLSRGENAYNSGHVLKLNMNGSIQPAIIKGEVKASMKKTSYSVEATVDWNRGILSATCTCPRGQVICHHMAALLLDAHYSISATDRDCTWSAKKPPVATTVQTMENLYPAKEHYVACADTVTEDDISQLQEMLGPTNVVGFSWLLKPEASHHFNNLLVPSIEDILFSRECMEADDKQQYLLSRCNVTTEKIWAIAANTIGQHKNEAWLIARKGRLTSSKFGMVLNAIRRNRFPPSLFKALLEGYDLSRALAVQWGAENEPLAKKRFVEVTGLQVEETGLWLDESGLMGTSPDGLIDEDSVLEIKCPYSFRNIPLKDAVHDRKYFFFYDDDDHAIINGDHVYYHQVQGQLYLTGRQACYFFVWTPTEHELLFIEKDPAWEPNLELLKSFYLNRFIPAMLDYK